ncbi:hypothetical protein [Leptospira sp. 'Mane']|uniref:hypothetical protein n=1 Tax=Leptospira sp. 'Mane' TaxID=3387407 RepID=UPI00398AD66D
MAKWEINFFVYEKDFTNSLKESYKQENFYTYKLTWKRREGILDPGSNSLYLKLNYNSIELGEVETNSLSELLNQINFFPAKKTAINEYDIYNIGKDSAWLAEEGMTGSDGASYIWRSEQGMMDTTSPNTKFLSFAHSKESSNYTSTNYDYTKNKWEVIPSNPDKLFYKPIYSDSKTEIFFVPPYANSSSSQTKEPVGFKRIGNFLLKEDVK